MENSDAEARRINVLRIVLERWEYLPSKEGHPSIPRELNDELPESLEAIGRTCVACSNEFVGQDVIVAGSPAFTLCRDCGRRTRYLLDQNVMPEVIAFRHPELQKAIEMVKEFDTHRSIG